MQCPLASFPFRDDRSSKSPRNSCSRSKKTQEAVGRLHPRHFKRFDSSNGEKRGCQKNFRSCLRGSTRGPQKLRPKRPSWLHHFDRTRQKKYCNNDGRCARTEKTRPNFVRLWLLRNQNVWMSSFLGDVFIWKFFFFFMKMVLYLKVFCWYYYFVYLK